MFKITFNKSFRFSLNNSTPATLIIPWLFGFTYNWCNTALTKQSPAPTTLSAFIPKWCNLNSKMFIAGGLTLHLFSHTLIDLGSTPHQQMDLTVWSCLSATVYIFSVDSVWLRCTMSSNVDRQRHWPKTSTKYRTPETSTKYKRLISKGLWKLREVITASYNFWTLSTNLKQFRYPRKGAASYNFWSIRTSLTVWIVYPHKGGEKLGTLQANDIMQCATLNTNQ